MENLGMVNLTEKLWCNGENHAWRNTYALSPSPFRMEQDFARNETSSNISGLNLKKVVYF